MKKTILFILIAATVLVSIWFKEGYVMGTAEDSLIFYNISRFLPESQFAWMEHPGLGRVTIGLTAARPTYEILTFFHKLGIPNFLIQALTFWFLLVSAGVGIYFIVKEFFPNLPNRYILLSVLFYWFNPLSLVNVWNRFLSAYIFSYGLLPIVTLFYIKGLRKKNYIWIFILILILPVYSLAFTYLAFDILLWIFLFVLSLFFYLTQNDSDTRFFYIKYFFLTLLLFILTNSWWIGQPLSLNIYQNLSSSVMNFDISNNLGILDHLSKKMGNLSDIFGLINASFLNENSQTWVKVFHSFPFILMQFLFSFIILFSITKYIKNQSILILGGLFFLSIYLAKGTNPPFGEIYQFIFANVPYLQVFRNPFEKASFILSLTVSLLIGFGIFNLISTLQSSIQRRFANLIYLFFLGYILLVLGFPFWMGLVFTSSDPPTSDPKIGYKVKIPQYYEEANNWLLTQGNNFRFIGFPLGDEGITYKWEVGYSGVELSSALFSTPGILHNTAVPYYHELVPNLQKILLSQNDFIKLANILNARFIFTRHDIDYERRKMENPAIIDKNLEDRGKNKEIKRVATFEKLIFWENLEWQDRTFYPATRVIESSNKQQVSELLNIDVENGEVLLNDGEGNFNFNNTDKTIEISYKKVNPARYTVNIKNTTPFVLVFSELFNDAWQANYQNKSFKHFRSNFYANGWLIDKMGDFTIMIEYQPQKLLELGEKISISSYLLIVSLFVLFALRSLKSKRV